MRKISVLNVLFSLIIVVYELESTPTQRCSVSSDTLPGECLEGDNNELDLGL